MTGRSIFPRLLLGLAIVMGALWLALNRNLLDAAAIEGEYAILVFGDRSPMSPCSRLEPCCSFRGHSLA